MNPLESRKRGVFLTLLLLAGCNQILGIEVLERGDGSADDADGGTDAGEEVFGNPSAADCAEYCGAIKDTCSTMNKASFASEAYCTGLCPHMQRRKDGSEANANTFNCRLKLVKNAAGLGADNVEECKSAGAGGNGMCGSSCEAYCQLFDSICGEFPALKRGDTCVSECEKLPLDRNRDATEAFGSMSDTLQCRLAHLGAASTSDEAAVPHCKHAAISVTSEYTPCVTETPRCEDFCTLTMNVCTDKMQQYETFQDCVAICKTGMTLKTALGPDEPIDTSHDTVACRRYHAYNALKTPSGVHCEHAGPTGDGHCGKICDSYCQEAKAACSKQYADKYTNDAACLTDCRSGLEAESVMNELDHHFNVAKGKASSADPMQCRVYRLSKAFLAPTAHCEAALGGAECAAN